MGPEGDHYTLYIATGKASNSYGCFSSLIERSQVYSGLLIGAMQRKDVNRVPPTPLTLGAGLAVNLGEG